MRQRYYYFCRRCGYPQYMVAPSTRWGKLAPCRHCDACDWQKAKELFDLNETEKTQEKDSTNEQA